MNNRRRIFEALQCFAEPITTKQMADMTGIAVGSVANECSRLELDGVAHRPDGPRNGYALLVDMLPEDARELGRLVSTYGLRRVRAEAGKAVGR